MIVITDEYIKEHGFKEYNPTRFDNDSVILRFQKRYDDDFGKKYFIDILKWDNSYVPADRRDKWWKPYSYTYETQITMFKDCKALNFEFFSDWTLEQVEKFMEEMQIANVIIHLLTPNSQYYRHKGNTKVQSHSVFYNG